MLKEENIQSIRDISNKILLENQQLCKVFQSMFHPKNYSLDNVLRNSDIVTVHIPYNMNNHNLISKNQISLLKNNCLIINTSRGNIVDEKYLYQFLKKNKNSNAIFDVMSVEPPNNKKLISLKNFLLTSHIAGTTHNSLETASVDCAKKILKEMNGKS